MVKLDSEEDPTFQVRTDDPETGQTLISGMGELHLDIIVDRMLRRVQGGGQCRQAPGCLQVRRSAKPVRSGDTNSAQADRRPWSVRSRVSRLTPSLIEPKVLSSFSRTRLSVGGAIPREFIPAVEQGIKAALDQRVSLAGYPVVQLPKVHAVRRFVPRSGLERNRLQDRRRRWRFKEAMPRSKPILLEPIMNVEVVVPRGVHGRRDGRPQARASMAKWAACSSARTCR